MKACAGSFVFFAFSHSSSTDMSAPAITSRCFSMISLDISSLSTPSPQYTTRSSSGSPARISYSLFLYSCSPISMQMRRIERPSAFSISSSSDKSAQPSRSAVFSATSRMGAPKYPVTKIIFLLIVITFQINAAAGLMRVCRRTAEALHKCLMYSAHYTIRAAFQ